MTGPADPRPQDDPARHGIPAPVTTAGSREDGGLRDYLRWHDAYDDPTSAVSRRLRRVQHEVASYLDATSPRPVRVVSLCAGDGRDVLGVLGGRDDRARVSGVLVEILPVLVECARAEVERLGLAEAVTVREADAGASDTYAGDPPADLVVASGVMGNISADDIHRLVHFTRELAAPGATVLWTRGRMEPDLGPRIRAWFDEAGFESVRLHDAVDGTPMRLGVERLVVDPAPLRPGRRIFTFLR